MRESQIKDGIKQQIRSEIFNIRLTNQLSDSILNYFSMSVGLFFYGCLSAEIIVKKNETESLFYEILLITGIIQIFLGIYDWYKGKTLTLLTNILFGILFISWYFKYYEILKKNKDKDYQDLKYEGVLYILFIVISLTLIIAAKNKGTMYSINYLVLAISFAFVVVEKYARKDWAKTTFGYAFIVTGALFWITGLLRILNNQFLNKTFFLVKE